MREKDPSKHILASIVRSKRRQSPSALTDPLVLLTGRLWGEGQPLPGLSAHDTVIHIIDGHR